MKIEELLKALETQKKVLEEVKVHIDNIEQEIKKLNENSFESTPKDWKPKRGEKYWVAHYNLSPTVFFNDEIHVSKPIIKYSRIFKTKEECEKYCEIQKAFRDKARPFIYNEANFIPRYKQETSEILISTLYFDQFDTLYFERNDLKELMKRFSKSDIKRYYLNIDD